MWASFLYPGFYLMAFISLMIWTAFPNRTGWGKLLALALVGYLLTWGMADASWSYRLGRLFQDMLVLAGGGVLARLFALHKVFFWIGMLMVLGLLSSLQLPGMYGAFPENSFDWAEEGELLLELQHGASLEVLDELAERYDLQLERAFFPENEEWTTLDDYWLVDIPDIFSRKRKEIKKALEAVPEVDWVEGNERVSIAPVEGQLRAGTKKKTLGVNDPRAKEQWSMEVLSMEGWYGFFKKSGFKARKKALVVILDTGVDAKHEDISGHYRSLEPPSDNDPRGHGTHCAGIAAAVTHNGKGIASTAWGNDYLSVSSIKVLNSFGGGSQRSIIAGMLAAADAGADVINLSLGGPSSRSRQRAYNRAVSYVNRHGGIVVCAAGNSADDARDYAPANAAGVITVSALGQDLQKAPFSNRVDGIEMALAAPGVDILSTLPGNKYGVYSGTSMAAPRVSGLIAMMKSYQPNLTTREAYAILNASGKPTAQEALTGKLIQPSAALQELLQETE